MQMMFKLENHSFSQSWAFTNMKSFCLQADVLYSHLGFMSLTLLDKTFTVCNVMNYSRPAKSFSRFG